MKTALSLIASLLLTTSALPVMAQSPTPPRTQAGGAAAATLPNTFDAAPARPAPGAARTVVPAAAATAAGAAPTAAEAARIDAAGIALRTAVAALQTGTPDYDAMTADVAAKLRGQAAEVIPLIQGFGEVVAGRHVGRQDGADVFGIVFDNAATEWMIALNPEGKIAVLLFRPAEASLTAGEAADPAAP